jgi:hypothetical protein
MERCLACEAVVNKGDSVVDASRLPALCIARIGFRP